MKKTKNKKTKKNKSKKDIRRRKFRFLLALIFSLVFIILSLSLVLFLLAEKERSSIYTSKYEDKIYWTRLFSEEEKDELIMSPNLVVLPYDLVLDKEINAFFTALKEVKSPEKIILIVPTNETSLDKNIATCEKCNFKTQNSTVNMDFEFIDLIAANDLVTQTDEVFENSEATLNLLPFIKNTFPKSNTIPISISDDLSADDINEFKNFISEYISEEDLVISAIHFSENELVALSEVDNFSTLNTIKNFDFNNVFDLDIEMPSLLYLTLKIAEDGGYKNIDTIKEFDLSEFDDEILDYTNTYKFMAFNRGENLVHRGVSFMSFGEINNDFDKNIVSSWYYDKEYDANSDLTDTKFLKELRGANDHFFRGIDYLVFDLDNESCVNYTQNSFTTTFCKYIEKVDETNGEIVETDLSFIDNFKEESDFVYLLYEFKNSELSEDRKKEIRKELSSDIDMFVGRGLKDFMDIDYYDGTVFIYSLNDFLTDSNLATSLTADSEGTILATYIDDEEIKLYFIPIAIQKGYPSLKEFNLRKTIFSEIISESDLPLSSFDIDAKKGYISIPR